MKGLDVLRMAYDMLLESEVPGLSTTLKLNPEAYEVAFKYWLDTTVDNAIETVHARTNTKDTGGE